MGYNQFSRNSFPRKFAIVICQEIGEFRRFFYATLPVVEKFGIEKVRPVLREGGPVAYYQPVIMAKVLERKDQKEIPCGKQ